MDYLPGFRWGENERKIDKVTWIVNVLTNEGCEVIMDYTDEPAWKMGILVAESVLLKHYQNPEMYSEYNGERAGQSQCRAECDGNEDLERANQE